MSDTVKAFIATSVLGSSSAAKSKRPSEEDLTNAIGEITLETTTQGASTLSVQVVDPYWEILTSGWLDADPKTGILDKIETEYPQGSGSWWRLCSVDLSRAPSSANVVLVFEDRIVAQLDERWGAKTAKPGTRTRAQFVRSLVDEVPSITFVCPSLNVLQPLESDTYAAKLRTRAAKRRAAAKKNKARGIGAGAALLLPPPAGSNSALSQEQIGILNDILDEATRLRASKLAVRAAICACVGESTISFEATGQYAGPFQASAANGLSPTDTTGQAHAFFKGGQGFQGGGAMALSATEVDPGVIAYKVEGDLSNFSSADQAAAHYSQYDVFAQQVIDAYGGLASSSSGSSTVTVTRSDVSQLARGSVDNPGEGSWACGTRLAQEVAWCFFTNGQTLYYMDGPDLIAQKPAAYIDLREMRVTRTHDGLVSRDVILNDTPNATFDNTAFTYTLSESAGKNRPRIRRGASAATPTEVRIDLVCEVDDYRGGDVFVLQNAGPINGRWIVNDATRRVFGDVHTSFTLGPSIAPHPEPTIQSTVTSPVKGLTLVSGGKAKINADGTASAPASAPDAVKKVIAAGNQIIRKPYVYGGGHGSFQDTGYDCSSAVSFALHGGGLADSPMDSVALETYGEAGPGQWITTYGSTDHAWMEVAGIFLDTSSSGSPGVPAGTGPRWRTAPDGNSGPGFEFVARHPKGL